MKTPSQPSQMLPPSTSSKVPVVCLDQSDALNPIELEAPKLAFSGRLSSIMPREVDSGVPTVEMIIEGAEDQNMLEPEQTMKTIAVDNTIIVNNVKLDVNTSGSTVQSNLGAFAFREACDNPFEDSDSEDELATDSPLFSPAAMSRSKSLSPTTPTAFTAISKTPRTSAALRFVKSQQIGFTPLAKQLTEWMAASPEESDCGSSDSDELGNTPNAIRADQETAAHPSPAKSSFFDDEMSVREDMVVEPVVEEDEDTILGSVGFAPVELDEEDLDFAQEAEELSVLEPEEVQGFQTGFEFLNTDPPQDVDNEEQDLFEITQLEQGNACGNVITLNHDMFSPVSHQQPALNDESVMTGLELLETDVVETTTLSVEAAPELALSEASQEYGDENENERHIDPEILALPHPTTPKYATPNRILGERVFHTVSKIPLKAAADDTPMRPITVKRSASISRLPVQRPSHTLSRSNTVISYSPPKKTSPTQEVEDMKDVPTTPSKSDVELWSTIATPARTPRRDLNTALLKGAVAFVDVHTSEGADASSIFTELLTQMGARCVKSWNWNGNSEDGSKIGITHVIFKDGGKRTLEKSRATGGVVSCVGVGWVLE